MIGPLLFCCDVRRRFGATLALDGASIEVDAGEIVAIMGPSGSGKSTLLHCLAGILRPDSGEVWYRGKRVDLVDESERSRLRRDEFGFVFQFGQLVPELSALENVSLPLRLGGMRRRDAEGRAYEWLERLEVAALAAKQPGELSGGEGQRVAISRALVGGPRVLFADEPTGALDSLNGERVMTLLVDAARSGGTSVILVTHEPRVAAYADREIVMRDGRVVTPVLAS
jgi:putative ABC transport system ATP-binding protein